jgi:large conductance mechanosensitive channel
VPAAARETSGFAGATAAGPGCLPRRGRGRDGRRRGLFPRGIGLACREWKRYDRSCAASSFQRKQERIMAEQSTPKSLLQAPVKHVSSFYEEFKSFAFKGNVVDLAIGVIIGAAFGKIIDSLVKHVIMPLISVLMPGEQSWLTWKWVINGKDVPYGLFLGEVINFLIVALALFIFIVKFLGWIMKNKKVEPAAPPPPTKEQELLTEIRDLLKARA